MNARGGLGPPLDSADSARQELPRRFPSRWHADPMPGGYVVRDATGQALAYLYSRDNKDEARQANVLTKDEARRIASNIARLPELLESRVRLAAALAFGSCRNHRSSRSCAGAVRHRTAGPAPPANSTPLVAVVTWWQDCHRHG
jgi:hypothetical protein